MGTPLNKRAKGNLGSYSVINVNKRKSLITLVNGTPVNLLGTDIESFVPATSKKPASPRIIRGATQEDLKILYEQKHSLITLTTPDETDREEIRDSQQEDTTLSNQQDPV